MGAIAVPILPGKIDDWKRFAKALKEERAKEFADHNKRHGLTRHAAWLQRTPDGGAMAVVLHEGPGGDKFMESLAASTHPFDVWLKQQIGNVHGLDFSKPPPGPPPELFIDGRA